MRIYVREHSYEIRLGEWSLFKLTPSNTLIIANVLVYAYTAVVSGNPFTINEDVLLWLGQDNAFVMSGGYWQLFTSMFVHINLLHLFGNMVFLLIFGIRAEDLFRTEEFFAIYLASGLLGNLLTLLMSPFIVSAGASGAIFGIFGAVVIYLRKTFGESIIGALIFSFFLLVLSMSAGVNIIAHFGGLVAGLIIGYTLAKTHKITL
ncbi:rhomboid family intramembrane serine protease [Candidatus Bathyarchaeota archaeon]|nr:MAG: rhomboid family intramembrane serine protease [Candidatus Bathyarchaeota archaeon]